MKLGFPSEWPAFRKMSQLLRLPNNQQSLPQLLLVTALLKLFPYGGTVAASKDITCSSQKALDDLFNLISLPQHTHTHTHFTQVTWTILLVLECAKLSTTVGPFY
jgi:hypothetical protein